MNQWAYETPLEPVPDGVTLDPRIIEINGMKFQARSDCNYKIHPYKLLDKIERVKKWSKEEKNEKPLENPLNLMRNAIQLDLWFLTYFVLKNPLANHPFIVDACREIEEEEGDSLETWARDHLKTTVISVGRPIQKLLNDPEKRIAIFSAVRPLAVKIQNMIKAALETEFLTHHFFDILYKDPKKDAVKWTEAPEGGLIVKRTGIYKEPSIGSFGLVEGTPTGDHYTDLHFDDIVTQDLQSPEMMQKVCDNLDQTLDNIGTRDRQATIVGTFYRHDDPLVYVMNKKDPVTNTPMFKHRKKTATVDGTLHGDSVFLPERTLARKRAGNIYYFHCQQLLDPTPRGHEKLNRDHLVVVSKKHMPNNLYRFMLIDGAGDRGRRVDREADSWAMGVIGVEPYRDELGASRIFIQDLVIEPMDLARAQLEAADMYCRNGLILKLGIEKVGMSTTEIHICNALRARGRHVSLDNGNLVILKPEKRTKEYRIESALSLPLKNSKIHISDSVPVKYRERLMLEMEKFPAWKDDGLDMLSYVYDIIKDYRFGAFPNEEKPRESPYDAAFRHARERRMGSKGFMAC